MDIINKIFTELEKKGSSQVEFAAFLGVPVSLITEWKAGRRKSYTKYLPKISEYLGVSVDYLLDIKETPNVDEDAELQAYLEELKTRPEMKMLFMLAKGATKADVEQAVKIIEALQKK